MCRKVIETYRCRVCDSECKIVSSKQLYDWQKVCSKMCINERWLDISDARILHDKRMKELKKHRIMMKKYKPNADWKSNANV